LYSAFAPASISFLDHRFRVGLADAFLHGLGRAVHQVLRLLEAQARKFADRLDDVDLVSPKALSVTVNSVFSSAAAAPPPPPPAGAATATAVAAAETPNLVFQILDQLRQLQYRHVGNRIEDFSFLLPTFRFS